MLDRFSGTFSLAAWRAINAVAINGLSVGGSEHLLTPGRLPPPPPPLPPLLTTSCVCVWGREEPVRTSRRVMCTPATYLHASSRRVTADGGDVMNEGTNNRAGFEISSCPVV
jgi:hypothetical protein